MAAALMAIRPAVRAKTLGHSCCRICTSISVPVHRKKSPRRRARKGRISASTWLRKLVSASKTPARKAPRVSERPIEVVITDVPHT
eukprot:8065807-Pyramimonas_sp.AAC.1